MRAYEGTHKWPGEVWFANTRLVIKERLVGEGVISAFHFSEVRVFDLFSQHKYKILRLVSQNVNVSRNIFIPASRFSSLTHEFFHALKQNVNVSRNIFIPAYNWQLLAVTALGSSRKLVPYYWHLQLLAVIHTWSTINIYGTHTHVS